MKILITGGAGFIGSALIRYILKTTAHIVVNLDKLTYAGNLATLKSLSADGRHIFVQGDIGDYDLVLSLLKKHSIRAVINFAAESHVDRSIKDPFSFAQTNVMGTLSLLQAAKEQWSNNFKDKLFLSFLYKEQEIVNKIKAIYEKKKIDKDLFSEKIFLKKSIKLKNICFSYDKKNKFHNIHHLKKTE